MQRVPFPARRQPAQHQLRQGPGYGRLQTVHVVRHPRVRGGCVLPDSLHPRPHRLQVGLQCVDRVARVAAIQEVEPSAAGHAFSVGWIHRPVVDLQRPVVEGVLAELVPAVVAVHLREQPPSVDPLRVRVDGLDDAAPDVDVPPVSGHQQRVGEAVGGAPGRGPAVRGLAAGGIVDRESPAVDAAVPLAVALAADRPVQSDVARDDPAVRLGALDPGVDIVDQPVAVAPLARQGVRIEGEGRRAHVERMVAHDVVVVLEVLEHLLVVSLAVSGIEPALDFDGVSGPVQGRGLAHQRSAAAVEHAADDLVLRVVVGRGGVVAHVEARVTSRTDCQGVVVWVRQPLEKEDREPLAVVEPVEHDREFLVVHAIAGEWHLGCPGLGVLLEMALPTLLVQLQDDVRSAESVEHRPIEHVLRRVVRAVVASPPGHA